MRRNCNEEKWNGLHYEMMNEILLLETLLKLRLMI